MSKPGLKSDLHVVVGERWRRVPSPAEFSCKVEVAVRIDARSTRVSGLVWWSYMVLSDTEGPHRVSTRRTSGEKCGISAVGLRLDPGSSRKEGPVTRGDKE